MNDRGILAAFADTMIAVSKSNRVSRAAMKHFQEMEQKMITGSRPDGTFGLRKLATWLGYLQGSVGPHGLGILTLDQLIDINKKYSNKEKTLS